MHVAGLLGREPEGVLVGEETQAALEQLAQPPVVMVVHKHGAGAGLGIDANEPAILVVGAADEGDRELPVSGDFR